MAKQLLGHPPVPMLPAAERGVVEQAWQVVKRATTAKRRKTGNNNFILLLLWISGSEATIFTEWSGSTGMVSGGKRKYTKGDNKKN